MIACPIEDNSPADAEQMLMIDGGGFKLADMHVDAAAGKARLGTVDHARDLTVMCTHLTCSGYHWHQDLTQPTRRWSHLRSQIIATIY